MADIGNAYEAIYTGTSLSSYSLMTSNTLQNNSRVRLFSDGKGGLRNVWDGTGILEFEQNFTYLGISIANNPLAISYMYQGEIYASTTMIDEDGNFGLAIVDRPSISLVTNHNYTSKMIYDGDNKTITLQLKDNTIGGSFSTIENNYPIDHYSSSQPDWSQIQVTNCGYSSSSSSYVHCIDLDLNDTKVTANGTVVFSRDPVTPSVPVPKIGSNDVLKIYFGNGEVQKIYLGNELVYNNDGGSGEITFEENTVLTNSLGLPLYPQNDYDEFSMPNNLEIPTVNWQENEDTGEGEVVDVTKTIPSSQIGMDLVSIYDLGASVGSTYYIPTFYTNQIGYSNPYFVYGGLYNSMQDALDALDTGINLSYPEISTALTREHCAIIFKVTWLGYDDPTGICCFANAYLQS